MINTKRTCIRPVELSDSSFILELVNSPGWLEFIGDRNVHSIEEAEAFLETGMLQSVVDRGFGYYCVSNLDKTPIGICGFLKKDYLENPDFGFAFLPQFGGQGLALESAREILAMGIQEFGFAILDAVTVSNNHKSIRLLEKLGFKLIGNLPLNDDDRGMRLYRRESICPETCESSG